MHTNLAASTPSYSCRKAIVIDYVPIILLLQYLDLYVLMHL